MPYRTFHDSAGTEWQVWDIVPRLSERRINELTDRRVLEREVPFPNRRYDARRLTETRRAVLRGSYAHGWLCFESDQGKRRLSPIPADWATCSDEELEAYSRRGERVSGSQPVVQDFNAEETADSGSRL
jgi:hypothetical protein